MREELEKLSVKDWDRIGYTLLAIYALIGLLTNPLFFVCLLYVGVVVLLTWWICRPARDDEEKKAR